MDEPLRREIEKRVLLLFLLVSTFSLAFLEGPRAWGLVAGACVSYLSFRSLRRTLERSFGFIMTGEQRVSAFVSLRYYMKLTIVFFLLGYMLKERKIEALGLATGLLVVPVALSYTGIKMYLMNRGGNTE
jgi:uncharacterized membrane protein